MVVAVTTCCSRRTARRTPSRGTTALTPLATTTTASTSCRASNTPEAVSDRAAERSGRPPLVDSPGSRACSSVGRALARQARGQGFDSPQVHCLACLALQSHFWHLRSGADGQTTALGSCHPRLPGKPASRRVPHLCILEFVLRHRPK